MAPELYNMDVSLIQAFAFSFELLHFCQVVFTCNTRAVGSGPVAPAWRRGLWGGGDVSCTLAGNQISSIRSQQANFASGLQALVLAGY